MVMNKKYSKIIPPPPKKAVKVRTGKSANGRALRKTILKYAAALALFYFAALAASLGWLQINRNIEEKQFFKLNEVKIEGAFQTTSDEILEAAALKGYENARINLLRLDLFKIERDLEKLPWVEDAIAKRDFSHALLIEIKERTATARADFGKHGIWLIGSSGKAFKKDDANEFGHLPLIEGLSENELAPAYVNESRTVAKAIKILAEFSDLNAASIAITGIEHYSGFFTARFRRADGGELLASLGGDEFGVKISRMMKLLSLANKENKKVARMFLDNRITPNRVAVKFENAAAQNSLTDIKKERKNAQQ